MKVSLSKFNFFFNQNVECLDNDLKLCHTILRFNQSLEAYYMKMTFNFN